MADPYAAGNPPPPSFSEDPVTHLGLLASLPPSRESLQQLAGSVASTISARNNVSSEVAFLYLRAAARHLPSDSSSRRVVVNPFAVAAVAAATAAASVPDANEPKERPGGSVEADMQSTKDVNLILEAVGNAVTCVSPRSLISQSGILPVLTSMLPPVSSPSSSDLAAPIAMTPLTNVHVELLQACLYAQQYRYAETLVANTWPRPTSSAISVRQVLRYFYIRGTIHIGCDNWKMARRCFWTCLSVPSEIVSAIAVAAWKKLVLVQCRTLTDPPPPGVLHHSAPTMPMQLPKAAPSCLTRFLSSACIPPQLSPSTSQPTAQMLSSPFHPEDPEAMHMVESSENESPPPQDDGGGGASGTGGAAGAENGYPSLGVKAYADLVQAFVRRDQASFMSLLNDHESLFLRDGNMGLVKQCQVQFMRRQVCFFSRIYSVVSLVDLSSFLNLSVDQVENMLLSLSMEKAWPIQIKNGIVYFPKMPLVTPRGQEGNEKEILQMTRMVQQLDAAVSASTKYVAYTKKGAAASAVASAASEAKLGQSRGVEDL